MAPRKSLRLIVLALVLASACVVIGIAQASLDAPAAFATPDYNNQQAAVSNGMTDNATFAADEAVFMEVDDISNGLGPIFNARSCADCHNSPNIGAFSQVTELRVGHRDAQGNFVSPTISINDGADSIGGRSLVNDRSICVQAAERVPSSETIHALRATGSTLGDGFVEAIDSNTLLAISQNQPRQTNGRIAGEFIQVPLSEAPGQLRAGRFGWKNQQASLLSFAADAYVNEQGVTSRLQPTDTTSVCKNTTDPEDHEGADGLADIDHFARFMRASQAPPRDESLANSPAAIAGAAIFHSIGCDICHVSSITTAAAGTSINGGTFTVPPALGGKVIHPYSDFLLHNIGTGDGIVQNGPPDTASKMRTAPLWGMRGKSRLMHDLLSFTRQEAIMRHGGEATGVTNNYRALTATQKNQILTFLNSL